MSFRLVLSFVRCLHLSQEFEKRYSHSAHSAHSARALSFI